MTNYQQVIGSYPTETETQEVVKRLLSEGYTQTDVTLFVNKKRETELNNPRDLEVRTSDPLNKESANEVDSSFWESLKDAFKVRDEDYYSDTNYRKEDDFLHSYRDDLRKGYIVVAVNKDDSEVGDNHHSPASPPVDSDSSDTHLDTLGTTAGFPDTGGAVQGMGNGGQRPIEPKSKNGVPPELEDTHGEADEATATEERLKQERQND